MITGIILASASPRREQLLSQIKCSFRVVPSSVEENNEAAVSPSTLVKGHAMSKAIDVAVLAPEDIVIGADTVVVLDGTVYGKPTSVKDACRMLGDLSGRTHSVWTGIAVVSGGVCTSDAVETRVTIASMTPQEIARYVDTGEPMDKAGAYAVQGMGAVFVERIDGCYFNVVGLPLYALSRLLGAAGVRLL